MLMTVERKFTAAPVKPDDDELRWYVVRCYSGAEWQVRGGLLKRGIDAFLPWHIVEIRRNRWFQGEIRPLFRGYLFAGLEIGQHSDEVRDVNGAMGVLKVNGQPVEVREAQLQKLRLQAAEEQMVGWGSKARIMRVNVGDWVAIPEGHPFEGTPVQIEAIDKRGQVTAYVGSIRVPFPLSALTEACRRPSGAIPETQ